MRRKKDNKRVLTGRPNNNSKSRSNRRSFKNRYRSQPVPVRQKKRQKKTNRTAVILMVIALVAFVIGAGIGISMSLDDGGKDEDVPQYKNVTVEMTTNLSDTDEIYYDSNLDAVDYNDQQDLEELNITNESETFGY